MHEAMRRETPQEVASNDTRALQGLRNLTGFQGLHSKIGNP